MRHKKFDYYIFVDFSENLIGYNIISNKKMFELLPKISRFRHYKETRNRKIYLKNVRNTLKRENIKSYFLKFKIKELYENADVYADILEFVRKNNNCIIFISVDDRQYKAFRKLVGYVDGESVVVKKESQLEKGNPEYKISLVLDNVLNIERNKDD